MEKSYLAALIRLHNAPVCCVECRPPTPLEIPARIFYRLKDHDLIACPQGHRGSLRDFKHARDHFGERYGPFLRVSDPEAMSLHRDSETTEGTKAA